MQTSASTEAQRNYRSRLPRCSGRSVILKNVQNLWNPARARGEFDLLTSYVRLVRGELQFRRLWLAADRQRDRDWFYTLAIYSLLLATDRHAVVALALGC